MHVEEEDANISFEYSGSSDNQEVDAVQTAHKHNWWRWLLIPLAAPIGAIIATSIVAIFTLITSLIHVSIWGVEEDAWYIVYGYPFISWGVGGFLCCRISIRLAPFAKTITGIVMLIIVGAFCLYDSLVPFINSELFTVEEGIQGVVRNIGGIVGGIVAVGQAYEEEKTNTNVS